MLSLVSGQVCSNEQEDSCKSVSVNFHVYDLFIDRQSVDDDAGAAISQ